MWWRYLGSTPRTEVFVSHRNARLTVHGRRLSVECAVPSRPGTTPHRTSAVTEVRVCELRRPKPGPARIGPALGLPASTVHRVLARHGLNRPAFLDRPPGR